MPSCIRRTVQAFRITKALLTRLMFGLHGCVCIWRVTATKEQPWYWCLVSTLVLLLLETVVTLRKKKGGEWKWFCPSVFLYLASTLPAIWFLELDLLSRRIRLQVHETKARGEVEQERLSLFLGKFNFYLEPDDWVKILEQVLLLVLIVGRWLLPKGEITREQLSQLLLVYIGMAADIIELFEAFKEEEVKYNEKLTFIILSLWTASLLQFCIVLSATKARRPRPAFSKPLSSDHLEGGGCCCSCCRSEILSILTTIVLQDGPFLVLRMMLIFRYNVVSYSNIFFTAKNTLVNVLQLYRLVVLYAESVKIIKRQRSDSLFDEMFLVKAGILANKLALIEKEGIKRNGSHPGISQNPDSPGNWPKSDDIPCFPPSSSDTEQNESTSRAEIDAIIIENPMNKIANGEHRRQQKSGQKSRSHPATLKSKSPASTNVQSEILKIMMMSLNPADMETRPQKGRWTRFQKRAVLRCSEQAHTEQQYESESESGDEFKGTNNVPGVSNIANSKRLISKGKHTNQLNFHMMCDALDNGNHLESIKLQNQNRSKVHWHNLLLLLNESRNTVGELKDDNCQSAKTKYPVKSLEGVLENDSDHQANQKSASWSEKEIGSKKKYENVDPNGPQLISDAIDIAVPENTDDVSKAGGRFTETKIFSKTTETRNMESKSKKSKITKAKKNFRSSEGLPGVEERNSKKSRWRWFRRRQHQKCSEDLNQNSTQDLSEILEMETKSHREDNGAGNSGMEEDSLDVSPNVLQIPGTGKIAGRKSWSTKHRSWSCENSLTL